MKKEYEVIKTYGDLIKYIKKYHLEDKEVFVGCEGYTNFFEKVVDPEAKETRLSKMENVGKYGDIYMICDHTGYEDEFEEILEKYGDDDYEY